MQLDSNRCLALHKFCFARSEQYGSDVFKFSFLDPLGRAIAFTAVSAPINYSRNVLSVAHPRLHTLAE